MVPAQSTWRWEAIPHSDHAFLVGFPSQEDPERVVELELCVKRYGITLSFSRWMPQEISPKFQLKAVWVHVSGVPYPLRHFLGLWAIGTVIGTTLDVDLLTLRRRGIIRILVGMVDTAPLTPFLSADVVVKTDVFTLRFEREPEDFLVDPDVVPFAWKQDEDPSDRGLDRDNAMDEDDPNKRSRTTSTTTEDKLPSNMGNTVFGRQASVSPIAVTPFNTNPTTCRGKEILEDYARKCNALFEENSAGSVSLQGDSQGTKVGCGSVIENQDTPVQIQHVQRCAAVAEGSVSLQGEFSQRSKVGCRSVMENHETLVQTQHVQCCVAVDDTSAGGNQAQKGDLAAADSSGGKQARAHGSPTQAAAKDHVGTVQAATPTRDTTAVPTSDTVMYKRRSSRRQTAADGSSALDEDSLSKAMRLQAFRNLDAPTGYLPMHCFAPFVVTATAYGEPRVVYGGVYTVGASGEGYFYPTWMAA